MNWDGPIENIYATLKAASESDKKTIRWTRVYIPENKTEIHASEFIKNEKYKNHKPASKVNQEWFDIVGNKEKKKRS